ncbi:glycosyltransferase [Kocuria palustris]|nr:glycosyltransferase [Kocuria palustris]
MLSQSISLLSASLCLISDILSLLAHVTRSARPEVGVASVIKYPVAAVAAVKFVAVAATHPVFLFMWYWLFVAVGALYAVYTALALSLSRFLFVPPLEWRDKIDKVLNFPKPIYLKCGMKRLLYRRRLILASQQPAYYTNYTNNRLKIFPGDKDNRDEFVREMTRRAPDDPRRRMIYGFFHPYANNGGGGERVLWQAVKATLIADDKHIAAIYVTSDAKPLEIFAKVRAKFGISVDEARCVFIYLRRFNSWIEHWKQFTLAGQLVGSFLLGAEALFELTPDVWVDTQGLPGPYMVVGLRLRIPIIAYVHYPVLQSDMFAKLRIKRMAEVFSHGYDVAAVAKFWYWLVLYYTYMILGALVEVTLCNGTFTYTHLKQVWRLNSLSVMEIVYPPCGEMAMPEGSEREPKTNTMVYVAQFRPEKRHDLVVREYHRFLLQATSIKPLAIPKLVLVGLCRTESDTATLHLLKALVKELELDVEFAVDCSYEDLQGYIARAKFGINAMWNEHFGIGVVEYIHGGAVPIVHALGGPFLDICHDLTLLEKPYYRNTKGYFFKLEEDPDFVTLADNQRYPLLSDLLTQIVVENPSLSLDDHLDLMRQLAAKDLYKFDDIEFNKAWVRHLTYIDAREKEYRVTRGDMEMVY